MAAHDEQRDQPYTNDTARTSEENPHR